MAICQPVMTEFSIPIVGGMAIRALPWEVAAGWRVAGLTVG